MAHFTLGATTVLFRIIIQTTSCLKNVHLLPQFNPHFPDECTSQECAVASVLRGAVTLHSALYELGLSTTETCNRAVGEALDEEMEALSIYVICHTVTSELGVPTLKSTHRSAIHSLCGPRNVTFLSFAQWPPPQKWRQSRT